MITKVYSKKIEPKSTVARVSVQYGEMKPSMVIVIESNHRQ